MSGQSKKLLGLVLVLFSVVYLASCAVPPPTQELADAETAVQEARDMGAAECAPEELAAAEAALAKGKAWASEFCSELEARRMLIDARAKAEEAKVKCATVEELMRSRYTAYTLAKTAYIGRTCHGPAAKLFDAKRAKKWANRGKR